VEICRRHIIPRQLKATGMDRKRVRISVGAIRRIIQGYTREAGLRNVEREINKLIRKLVFKMVEEEQQDNPAIIYAIGPRDVKEYLGVEKITDDTRLKQNRIGVATGLAWTPVGGDILFIETSIMKGKGQLILTGQLGDVMKESAQAALSYVRSNVAKFNLETNFFEKKEIHVHVPAGATPKDGPSAGITMFIALVSLLTQRPTRANVAMTGEITLRGRVLPVGGIKEKVLAAKEAGLKTVILPKMNEKDLEEVPKEVRDVVEFKFIEEMEEAIKIALEEN